MTTLDGREPIAGVDLDIGKPIVSTRTLETSMTVVNGADPSGIVLPAPDRVFCSSQGRVNCRP